jgi:hypothetical protein
LKLSLTVRGSVCAPGMFTARKSRRDAAMHALRVFLYIMICSGMRDYFISLIFMERTSPVLASSLNIL